MKFVHSLKRSVANEIGCASISLAHDYVLRTHVDVIIAVVACLGLFMAWDFCQPERALRHTEYT